MGGGDGDAQVHFSFTALQTLRMFSADSLRSPPQRKVPGRSLLLLNVLQHLGRVLGFPATRTASSPPREGQQRQRLLPGHYLTSACT